MRNFNQPDDRDGWFEMIERDLEPGALYEMDLTLDSMSVAFTARFLRYETPDWGGDTVPPQCRIAFFEGSAGEIKVDSFWDGSYWARKVDR